MFVKGPGGQDEYLVTVESHELSTVKDLIDKTNTWSQLSHMNCLQLKDLVDKTNTWSQLSHMNCLQLKDWWTRQIPGHS